MNGSQKIIKRKLKIFLYFSENDTCFNIPFIF